MLSEYGNSCSTYMTALTLTPVALLLLINCKKDLCTKLGLQKSACQSLCQSFLCSV